MQLLIIVHADHGNHISRHNQLTYAQEMCSRFLPHPGKPPIIVQDIRGLLFGRSAEEFIKLGTPTASISQQIADVQRLLKQSGLEYSMQPAGTIVGKYDVAGLCYTLGRNVRS